MYGFSSSMSPPSALNDAEIHRLMQTLKDLKARGVTCIYISHKLRELFEIADPDHSHAGRQDNRDPEKTEDLTEEKVIAMMVGRPPAGRFPPKTRRPGPVMLRVKNWTVRDPENRDLYAVRDVSFEARSGEILGIWGLMGSGPHGALAKPIRGIRCRYFRVYRDRWRAGDHSFLTGCHCVRNGLGNRKIGNSPDIDPHAFGNK